MIRWHIITGEYPPQLGGVGDYSRLVACGLAAAGDEVNVWAPEHRGAEVNDHGIRVHRLPGHFGSRALGILADSITGAPEERVLVQYVPHAYGLKAMNFPFCTWLFRRRRRYRISVMFHEVNFPLKIRQPLRHSVLGIVTKVMARLVALSAREIYVAASVWEAELKRFAHTTPIKWLPVPSNIPVVNDPDAAAKERLRYGIDGGLLIGHFGYHGLDELAAVLPAVLDHRADAAALLIGAGSVEARYRLAREHPLLASRIHATGPLEPRALSLALSICDVMVQPYPDGVSTRRGSMMASLAHGRAVVTNRGIATEPLWEEGGAVALVPRGDTEAMRSIVCELAENPAARISYASAGRELYEQRFDVRHTINALRSPVDCVMRPAGAARTAA